MALTVLQSGYAPIISQSHARLALTQRDKCNGCTNAINATHVLIEGYTLLLSQGEYGRIAYSPKGRESQLARQQLLLLRACGAGTHSVAHRALTV